MIGASTRGSGCVSKPDKHVWYWRPGDPSDDPTCTWMIPNTGDPQNDDD